MPTFDAGHYFLTALVPVRTDEIKDDTAFTSPVHALRKRLDLMPTAAQTPACGISPAQLEFFSAAGGDPILFNTSGTRLATPLVRQKPDLTAPDGVNTSFTLVQSPNPAGSLAVYRNGMRIRSGLDYTSTGSSIAFSSGYVPQIGDVIQCSYRIAQ